MSYMRWFALALVLAGCEVDTGDPLPPPRSPDECVQQGGTLRRDTIGNVVCDDFGHGVGAPQAQVSAGDAGAHD